MKLRAQFEVNVTAADFVQAADHQMRLSAFLEGLKQQYSDATLTIKERRQPKLSRRAAAKGDLAVAG
jgi:hypothetical protein